jgi:site-specific DNA-methyltransferase (cytosine-N4-specific)
MGHSYLGSNEVSASRLLRLPLEELLSEYRSLLSNGVTEAVTTELASSFPVPSNELQAFFADLDSCRDKNYLTHGLHPYPAKFIPHIPRALLEGLAPPGGLVLDPMCGSGTTLVEGTLLGYPTIGTDLNPIAVLATKAKTLRLDQSVIREIERFLVRLDDESPLQTNDWVASAAFSFRNHDKWFTPWVAEELSHVLGQATALSTEANLLVRATLSAIVVAVSNQESETRWCAKPNPILPGETIRRFSERLRGALTDSHLYSAMSKAPSEVWRADTRSLPLPDSSVDTIITSPPYANSHDYYLYNKLRMFVLGYDVLSVQLAEIGSRNKHSDLRAPIDDYLGAMKEAFTEWRRVLIAGGRAAVVVGDAVIRGEFFDMGEELASVAAGVGLALEQQFRFAHRRFNSTFQRGFGTQYNKHTHVLIFR